MSRELETCKRCGEYLFGRIEAAFHGCKMFNVAHVEDYQEGEILTMADDLEWSEVHIMGNNEDAVSKYAKEWNEEVMEYEMDDSGQVFAVYSGDGKVIDLVRVCAEPDIHYTTVSVKPPPTPGQSLGGGDE